MRVHLQKGILTNVKLLSCLKYEIKALKSKRIITSRSISFQLEHQKLCSKLFTSSFFFSAPTGVQLEWEKVLLF